jgi:glyoxylase-like metal-dependent hydrolase (beta-lactamase superfamily II)
VIFRQFYLNCLAHASYLIGDDRTKTAAVVDPQRDVQQYLDAAAESGLQIRDVFLTHLHADFIAGHLELRDRANAQIHLAASAQVEYAFVPMHTGDALEFGDVRLQALETPGHTPESLSILVYDLARDRTKPYAVLTGDTLFIGDVGRPDLRASLGWSVVDLGKLLYRSLHDKLLPLPDDTLVYPAHGAGSLCGKKISKETVSTIGDQRRTNYALQPMTEDEFLALVTADQPDAPRYFTYDAVLNAKERATLEDVLQRELKPVALADVIDQASRGAQVLDVREPTEFAQGHLRGSINIGLGGSYATWAGTLLDRNRSIIIVAAPGREAEAAMRLGRIGFDNVAGYLRDGMQALIDRPDLLAFTEQISPTAAAGRLGDSIVIDVRTEREWRERHIDGSINLPLNHLEQQLDGLDKSLHFIVHCAAGYRSSIAISLLQRAGIERVTELSGGLAAWDAAKLVTTNAD